VVFGFFALLLASVGLCFVTVLRWPDGMTTRARVLATSTFRVVVQATLLSTYPFGVAQPAAASTQSAGNDRVCDRAGRNDPGRRIGAAA
jgi:hypothetical protein